MQHVALGAPKGASCLETRKSENRRHKSLPFPGQRKLPILVTTVLGKGALSQPHSRVANYLFWLLSRETDYCLSSSLGSEGAGVMSQGRFCLHPLTTHPSHWKLEQMPKDVHPPCRAQMAPETWCSEA